MKQLIVLVWHTEDIVWLDVLNILCVQEEKTGEKASEAKEIKLYGQIPPIEKMDAALSTLTCCE